MNIDINWNVVADMFTVIEAIAVLFALGYAALQVREATQARKADAMRQVFEFLTNPEARNDRKFLYQSANANVEEMSEKDRERLQHISVVFNNVGYLVEKRYLPPKDIHDLYGEAIVKAWVVLGPLVKWDRKRRGEPDPNNPYYLKYFQKLADGSKQFLEKHYPGWSLKIY